MRAPIMAVDEELDGRPHGAKRPFYVEWVGSALAVMVMRPGRRSLETSVSYPVGWTRHGKAASKRRIIAIHARVAAKRKVILRLKRVRRAPASNRQ